MNKTDQYTLLIKCMHTAVEDSYFIEAVSIEYAIIENRITRLDAHLKLSNIGNTLSSKTKATRNAIKERNLFSSEVINQGKRKSINEHIYHNFKELLFPTNDQENSRIDKFRKKRNSMTHKLADFDETNSVFSAPSDFEELAHAGMEIALDLDRKVSTTKRLLKRNNLI